jgi:hypothetical protein
LLSVLSTHTIVRKVVGELSNARGNFHAPFHAHSILKRMKRGGKGGCDNSSDGAAHETIPSLADAERPPTAIYFR